LTGVDELDDARVIELAQDVDFALKASEKSRVAR
jgi:hypothetical protein